MKKNQDEIISKFEAELKSGKNPGVPDFVRRHQVRSQDLIGALYMLQALYQDKELMKLPAGFKEEQNKLAQCLIDGKPTDWYFRRHRTPEMKVRDVPHPLTKEFGQVPVVTLAAAGKACKVALALDGVQHSSPDLARFLDKRAMEGREVCFLVGGPEGLPAEVVSACEHRWSLSRLTFPHDLAMVVLLEALYRASTIQKNHPYHK